MRLDFGIYFSMNEMGRSQRLRVAFWMVVAPLIAIGAGYGLVHSLNSERTVMVHVASPERISMSTSVTSNGRVIPVDNFQARAAFSGTVAKVYVHIGDKVHAGSPLVTMNDVFAPSRYASAAAAVRGAEVGDENIENRGSQEDRINMRGDLERAEQEKADAEKQLSMLRTLLATGAASQGEVENAQHRLSVADETLATLRDRMAHRYSPSEIAASRARLADARASMQTARQVLANANVVSTISGTVYSLPVAASDFVNMGAELMSVTDLSKVQVHAYVDEPEIGQLALNQPVTVRWDAKPDKVWHGHVSQVPLTVSSMGTRVVGECGIVIDDADGTLLPNTNVTVTITTSKPNRALTVPRAALRGEAPDRFVFRIVAGRIKRTNVQTGIIGLDQVQIVHGLSDDDVVVVSSTTQRELTDGLRAQAIP